MLLTRLVCFWTTTRVMQCKHTHSQGININKADEYVKAYHWKAFEQKIFVRLLSKLYLHDIYRLDIPTTLIKPRDDKDSVEFYVITTINTEGTPRRLATPFWKTCSVHCRLASNMLSGNSTCNISQHSDTDQNLNCMRPFLPRYPIRNPNAYN